MPLINTSRLHLDLFTLDDAAFILKLVNEPGFHRYIGDRGVRTLEDAQGYLRERVIPSYERYGFGLWRVALKRDGQPIGMCGLLQRPFLDVADIGYAVLETMHGQGYAVEAATATLAYARDNLGLGRIKAIVAPDNERSIHLLAKLGFVFDSTLTWPDSAETVALYTRSLE